MKWDEGKKLQGSLKLHGVWTPNNIAVKIKAPKDILFDAKIIKHKSIVIVLQTFDIIRLNASQIYH